MKGDVRQRLQAVVNRAYGQNGALPEMPLEELVGFLEFAAPDTALLLQKRTEELQKATEDIAWRKREARRIREAWRTLAALAHQHPEDERDDWEDP